MAAVLKRVPVPDNAGGPDYTYPPYPATTIIDGTMVVNATQTPAPSSGLLTAYSFASTYATLTVTPGVSGVLTNTSLVAATGYATVLDQAPDVTVTVDEELMATTTGTALASGVLTETIRLGASGFNTVMQTVTVTEVGTVEVTGCFSSSPSSSAGYGL